MTLKDYYEHIDANFNTSWMEDSLVSEIHASNRLLAFTVRSLDAYLKGHAQESILKDTIEEITDHLEKFEAYNPLKKDAVT